MKIDREGGGDGEGRRHVGNRQVHEDTRRVKDRRRERAVTGYVLGPVPGEAVQSEWKPVKKNATFARTCPRGPSPDQRNNMYARSLRSPATAKISLSFFERPRAAQVPGNFRSGTKPSANEQMLNNRRSPYLNLYSCIGRQ